MDRRHFLILGLLAGFFVGYGVSELLIAGIPLPSSGDDLAKPLTGAEAVKYKEECRALDLSTSRENPYALNGQNVWVEGTVYKKGESYGVKPQETFIALKINTTPDYILLSYAGTTPIKMGDHIKAYGEYFYPAEDTTTPELKNKELPMIKVVYIEKINS
ncbi:hypothetical protein [Methanothermobacter sp.]|uniref:hypothetical protein n=1 Tax=Methanothermobacter sp. TaxID=1884223 RepID=UPI003C7885E6